MLKHVRLGRQITIAKSPRSRLLADAIRLIDGVHRDGQVNPIRLDVASTNLIGFLEIESLLPTRIVVDPENDRIALTVTHEVGHFIEWAGIPKTTLGFRNFETDPLLEISLFVADEGR